MKSSIWNASILITSRWDLTETEKKILNNLAEKGSRTYYDIYKKERLCSSSTAWNLIKNLEKNGYVEVKKEEKFELRGRKKKFYSLTLRGLSTALSNRSGWKNIDTIVKQHESLLPLMFGKWQHFKKYVDNKNMTDALRYVMLLSFPIVDLNTDFESKEYTRETFAMKEFCVYILQSIPEERIGWLKAIQADTELRQWMLGNKWKYKQLELMIDLSFSIIQHKEPDWDEALRELRSLSNTRLNLKEKS